MVKTSIRFFDDSPVRAVWDDDTFKWWFCAMDIAQTLTKSNNSRVYWVTMKRRNPQLIAICKQLKSKWELRKACSKFTDIFAFIKGALTDEIDNREMFMKGIDYSYYYETED